MTSGMLALRGATTFEVDERDHVSERVIELVTEMLARNDIAHDDLISIIFTATGDLSSVFPATAARALGLGDVPLICARELDIAGAMPRCVRILMHFTTVKGRSDLRHVYLHDAKALRDDLPA